MTSLTATIDRFRNAARELMGYALATCLAFAIDLGVLTLLASGVGLHYAVAAGTAFIIGAIALYLLCVRFVFRYRRHSNSKLELSYFIGIGILGLGIQTIVMVTAVELLHTHYLIGKFAAAGCTFAVNFLLRRTLLFTPPAPG